MKKNNEEVNNNKSKDNIKEKVEMKKTNFIILLLIIVISLTLLSFLGIVIFKRIYSKTVVMTYDDIKFTRNDYMMYLRLAKTSLFDEKTNKLPKATLNTIIDKENNVNVDTYLRNKVEQSLKIAGAVQAIAKRENIVIDEEKEQKLKDDKEKYINSLGGKDKFIKFLKENNTTEEAYDNMAYTDMLYNTIYSNLYSEGKIYDLTEKEKENAKQEYEKNYYKARQILFIFVDPSTNDPAVEQKKLLADTVREKINNDSNFDEFIKKYSDDAVDADPPYDMYFKSGEVLQEIEDTTKSLDIGEVSDVIKSNYAFHIIKRDALDDSYLNKIYEQKREEKFMKVVNDQINHSVIIIEDSFTNMKIN